MTDRGGANLGTATGRITVDTSQAISSLNQFGSALSSFDARAAQVGSTTNQFTQSTVGLAQGMQHIGRVAVGLGATLGAPFVGAVKTAADFEQGMANVNAVMDLTDDQFSSLSDLAVQLGRDTVFTADEAAEGIETLGKAGLDYESIMNGAAQAVTDLAAAGQTTIPRAAEVTAAAMNAFNLEGEDTVRIADAIAGAANASQSDVNQLGIGLAQVSGVAAAANMDLEETAAFMAILADNGLSGSDAATSMKTAILALLSPTDKAAEAMAGLGVELLDTEGNFVGLEGASREFFDAWKRSGQTMSEFMEPLTDVLGRDAIRTILFGMQAIESETTGVGKSFSFYEDAVSEAGIAQQIAAERMDSLLGKLEKLRGSLSALATTAGLPIVEALQPLVTGADMLVDALARLPQPILTATAAFTGIIGILTAVGGAFLVVGGYVLEASARMAAAGFPISRLIAILTRLLGILGLVTAAATVAGLAWQNNWGGIQDKVREAAEDLQFFAKVGEESSDNASEWGRKIEGFGEAIDIVLGTDISGVFNRIADAADYLDSVMKRADFGQQFFDIFKRESKRANEAARNIEALGKTIDAVTDNALDVSRGTDAIAAFIDAFAFVRDGNLALGVNGLSAALFGLAAGWRAAFGPGVVDEAFLGLGAGIETLTSAFNVLREQGLNPVAAALGAVATLVNTQLGMPLLAQRIAEAAESAQAFGNIFRQVEETLRGEGFTGAAAMIQAFGEALRQVTGIDITGFTENLSEAINAANRSWQDATAQGVNPFIAALDALDAFMLELIDNPLMEDAWVNFTQGVGEATAGVRELIGSGLDRLGQLFNEVGTAISSGDFSGVLTAFQSLATDIGAEIDKIVAQLQTIEIPSIDVVIGNIRVTGGNLLDAVRAFFGLGATESGQGAPGGSGGAAAGTGGFVIPIPQITAEIQNILPDAGDIDVMGLIEKHIIGMLLPVKIPMLAFTVGEMVMDQLPPGVADDLGTDISNELETAGVKVFMDDWELELGVPDITVEGGDIGSLVKTELEKKISEIDGETIKASLKDWIIDVIMPDTTNVNIDAIGFASVIGAAAVKALGEFAGGVGGTLLDPDSQEKIQQISFDIGNAVGQFLISAVTTGLTQLPNLLKLQAGAITAASTAIASFLAGLFSGIWEAVGNVMDLPESGTDTMGGPGERGESTRIGERIAITINDFIQNISDSIFDALNNIPAPTLDFADNPLTQFIRDMFTEIGNGAVAEAEAAGADEASRVGEAVRDAAKQVNDAAENAVTGGAPLSLVEPGTLNGEQLVTSYEKGASIGAGQAAGAINPDPFNLAGEKVVTTIVDDGLLPGIQLAADDQSRRPQTGGFNPFDIFKPIIDGLFPKDASAAAIDEATKDIINPQDVGSSITASGNDQLGEVADNVDLSLGAGTLVKGVNSQLDAAMAAQATEALTLEQFTQALGQKLGEVLVQAISEASTVDPSAGGGAAADAAGGGIGQSIANALASSLSTADFSAVGQAIQAKIGSALAEGVASDTGTAGQQVAGAAGGLGAAVAQSIAGQIGTADFTAVGQAIQAKIGAALIAGAQQGGAGAEGAVAGAAGGLGASIAQSLAGQIGAADFTLVGQALQAKIGTALVAGMQSGGAAGGQVAGAAGGLGASLAQAIASQVGEADFSAVGSAIASKIGESLGQSTEGLQSAMQAVMQAVVAAGQQASSQAAQIGLTIMQNIGSGIGPNAGIVVSAVQAAVTTAIQGGVSSAAAATTIGQTLITNAGSGVGSSTGTLVSAVQAAVQTGIDGGNSSAAAATTIGETMMTQAGAGVGAQTGALTGAVQAAVQAGIDAGVAAGAGAARIGENIIAGIVAGINSGAGAVADAVARVVADGIAAGQAAANASSPSKEAIEKIGLPIAQGIEVGMQSGEEAVVAAGKKLAQGAIEGAAGIVNASKDLKAFGQDLEGVRGFDTVSGRIQSIADEIAGVAKESQSAMRDLVRGMKSELDKGADTVGRSAADLGSAVSKGMSAASGAGTATKPSRDAFKGAKSVVGDLKKMKADVNDLEALASRLDTIRGFHDLGGELRSIAGEIETNRTSALDSAKGLMRDLKQEFNAAMKEFRQSGKDVGDSIASGMSEGITEATTAATEATQSMTESMIEQLNPNLSRLPEMANALGAETGEAVSAGLETAAPAVSSSAAEVGDAVTEGLASTEPATEAAATDVVEGTTEAMNTAATEQSEFARTIGELISTTFGEGFASGTDPTASLEMVQKYHDGIRNAVASFAPQVQQQGSQIGQAFTNGVDATNPSQSGKGLVDEVSAGVNTGMTGATDTASKAGSSIGGALQSSIEEACAPVNASATELTDSCVPKGIEAGENAASKIAQDAGENISSNLVDGLDVKKKDVERAFSLGGQGFGKSLASGIGGTVSDAVNTTQNVSQKAGSVDAGPQGKGVGQSFGQGIAQGIEEYIPEIIAAAKKAVQKAEEAAKDEGKAKSPSHVFAEIGRDLSLGMAMGMEQGADAIIDASQFLVRSTAAVFSGEGVRRATREFDSSIDRYVSRVEDVIAFAETAASTDKLPRSARIREARPRATPAQGGTGEGPIVVKAYEINGVTIEAESTAGRAFAEFIDALEESSGQYLGG